MRTDNCYATGYLINPIHIRGSPNGHWIERIACVKSISRDIIQGRDPIT